MVKVIWLPLAIERLEEIHTYYKEKSKQVANQIKKDIKSATISLKEFPQMGTLEPTLSELSIDFRYLVVRGNYKIIYFIEDENVNIATIWDCRQDNKL